jgi:transposase
LKGGKFEMEKKYYIGLDVHKRQTTYAVKDWNGITLESGETATQFADLQGALVRYIKRSVVVMEACTNYYHLYKKMKEEKIDVHVANVIQLRKLIGKNDKLDAKRLADMSRLNTMPESYIPGEKVQNLRILISLYHSEVIARVRYNNQVSAVLDRNGVNLPVKNPFGKKGLAFINQYLQENNDFALRNLLEGLKNLNERIEHLSSEILAYLKANFLQEYELLKSIPGVGDVLAGYLIAEICPIERFASKKKLRRYAGVVPVREQSDKKIYATYLPKHASRKLLRYALVLAANCAVRTDCRLRIYYRKKKKGSNHGHAIMCVASSLSDIIYAVLKTKQPYRI